MLTHDKKRFYRLFLYLCLITNNRKFTRSLVCFLLPHVIRYVYARVMAHRAYTPLTQKAPATRKCFQSPILGRPAASDLRAYYGAVTACIPVFLPGAHSSRPASPQQPQPFPETTANHPLKTYCMWPVSHSQGETFGISFSSSEERHNSVVCETGSSHLTEQTQQVSSRGKNGTRYVIYANI